MDDIALRFWAMRYNERCQGAFTRFLSGTAPITESMIEVIENLHAQRDLSGIAEAIEDLISDLTNHPNYKIPLKDLEKVQSLLEQKMDLRGRDPIPTTPPTGVSTGGGILSDRQIRRLAQEEGMIEPFCDRQIVKIQDRTTISHGLSSYGYDARVANEFKVFTNVHTAEIDPKNFDPRSFVDMQANSEGFIRIPPNSFALGRTVERFSIPRDVLVVCLGKSTYARCGIIVNVTPLEPCLSSDSEILTENGWVGIGDARVGDIVLTRREDGVAEYQPVERTQAREYKGDMIHFAGRSVDQLVTPDHKVFGWYRNSRSNTYRGGTFEAKSVYGKYGYSFDRQVTWAPLASVPDQVTINGSVFSTDAFLRFLGCYLGDGSAYLGADGGYSVKLAVVSKEKKREAFRSALQDLGVVAREHESGFHFYSKPLATYLMQFGHAREKFIDVRWKNLPPEKLKILLEGLMASDGCALTNTYTTVSKRLADDVQEIAFKSGSAAIVREVTGTLFGTSVTAFKVRVCDVHMTPKMPPRTHKIVAYDGMVYDVTVPNHVFLSRRRGKVSWTGNCWEGYVTLEFSNTTPLPARIYAGEGACQFLFFGGTEPCEVSYADRKGKYQDQEGVTIPRMK